MTKLTFPQSTWRSVFAFLLCLALLPTLALAQPTLDPGDGPEWIEIDDGVHQRLHEDGTVETVARGANGLRFQVAVMEEQQSRLEGLSSVFDSSELRQSLDMVETELVRLNTELARLEGADEDLDPISLGDGVSNVAGALGCNLTVTRSANAYPTSSGPAANATASFSDTCATQGKVKATAYADGIYSGAFRSNLEIDPASGWRHGTGSASASASASVVATSDCYSYGYAQVVVYDSLGNPANFFRFKENFTCRTSSSPCITCGPDGGPYVR